MTLVLSKTGLRDPPILTPFIFPYILPWREKAVFWLVSRISYIKDLFVSIVVISLSEYISFRIMPTLFFIGTLENSETASNYTNTYSL